MSNHQIGFNTLKSMNYKPFSIALEADIWNYEHFHLQFLDIYILNSLKF